MPVTAKKVVDAFRTVTASKKVKNPEPYFLLSGFFFLAFMAVTSHLKDVHVGGLKVDWLTANNMEVNFWEVDQQ